MYTHVLIVILSAPNCFCYAGYELFQGFSVTDVDDTSDVTTDKFLDFILNNDPETSQTYQITTTFVPGQSTTTNTKNNYALTTSKFNKSMVQNSSNIYEEPTETTRTPMKPDCPKNESPSNIGAYEIPTQKDLVLFTRNILLDMFNSYSNEAFYFLKDIKEVTKATASIEKHCPGNKIAYRQCIKSVSKQYQQITKNTVNAIETLKEELLNLTNVKICSLSELTMDPIQTLKSLAQEKVYLAFALPGFLRLLNACSLNCRQSSSASNKYKIKPKRHMTDQDLVIKHLLTRKNYLELIMDSKHRTIANSN